MQPFTLGSAKKHHVCPLCASKSFLRSNLLKQHRSVHTGEKPFTCLECSKSFSRSSLLKQHMSNHTGEKPFNCSICTKSFTQLRDLNRHKRVHTGEKPFSCLECSKSFSQSSCLKQHMSVHTGDKPFSCLLTLDILDSVAPSPHQAALWRRLWRLAEAGRRLCHLFWSRSAIHHYPR